jgi:hypothetical protein
VAASTAIFGLNADDADMLDNTLLQHVGDALPDLLQANESA